MKDLYTFKDSELWEYLLIRVNIESNSLRLDPIRSRQIRTQTRMSPKFHRQGSPYFLILTNGSKSGALNMEKKLKKANPFVQQRHKEELFLLGSIENLILI